jgi:hypothetical protein
MFEECLPEAKRVKLPDYYAQNQAKPPMQLGQSYPLTQLACWQNPMLCEPAPTQIQAGGRRYVNPYLLD